MCRYFLGIWSLTIILTALGVNCVGVMETGHVETGTFRKGAVTDGDRDELIEKTVWLSDAIVEILGNGMSSENGTHIEESRKRKTKNKPQPGFMEKILPMMVTPFMISSSMIPMMLISILAMLVKSAFIGKIGVILLLINMFRNRSNSGGFFTHNVDSNNRDGGMDLAMEHYGYHGDEEYGAYVNRRRRRRRRELIETK